MQEVQQYFSENAITAAGDNEKINIHDYYAFLSFVFEKCKLNLFEHKNDTEDFFLKANSSKTILLKVEDYLREVQNLCNIIIKKLIIIQLKQ